jgi:hypothetical protein
MKSIFDESTRAELQTRIGAIDEHATAKWGKMNVHQMLRHCYLWDEMVLRNKKYKRMFIGRILGKMLLKNELKDRPMRQNNPTIPPLIIKETQGNVHSEKSKWITLIKEYGNYTLPDNSFVHPFFGKMTREQIGLHAYKHTDHHLRQFGF